MVPAPHHVDVAAYVLGILDEPEDAAFARHFATCERCRAEYRELADLPRLLDQVKPQYPQRKPATVPTSAAAAVAARRRPAPRRAPWLVAAAVILLVGISVVVLIKSGQPGSGGTVAAGPTAPPSSAVASSEAPTTTTPYVPPTVAGARTVNGANAETGVSGTIAMESQPWGTKINLELRGAVGPMQAQLIAVSKSGDTQVVVSWPIAAGAPASPTQHLEGGVGMSQEDIVRFDLRRDGGTLVLVVPAA